MESWKDTLFNLLQAVAAAAAAVVAAAGRPHRCSGKARRDDAPQGFLITRLQKFTAVKVNFCGV